MLTHIKLRSGKNIIMILESGFVHQTLNCRLKKKINQTPCLCLSVITVLVSSLDS